MIFSHCTTAIAQEYWVVNGLLHDFPLDLFKVSLELLLTCLRDFSENTWWCDSLCCALTHAMISEQTRLGLYSVQLEKPSNSFEKTNP